ncbi:hypothetical protein HELRODRAFT_94361 [Helobdella robusta]|uniref:DNA replication licensing factor MCM3 n=1 Tax=Helobdella robusta TaxID=6412 RepID=T1G905_HELRO|nr:hypothetical protein HELRODRAFT_94361 [Helobdella robusta]ESO02014.1 hypothetical protein HELRODRAFT_94361 [Helobdella robusta]
MADADLHFRQIVQEYLDFLDDNDDQWIYHKRVKDMIADGRTRLLVNINDLRRKNPSRALRLLQNGFEELIAFQKGLKEFVDSVDQVFGKQHEELYIGLEGSFGSHHLTPRTLNSSFLGNTVCIEGIVSKCSLVRPKISRSVHYCPATKKSMERKYTDMTSLDAFPSSGVYPTKDENGNLLETEYGLSTYKDHQTFSIQEMPEKAPAGQLPRSVDIIADDDLIDNCKPGDRVQVIALYRCLPSKKNGFTSGTFRTILVANNVQLLNKELHPTFSSKDISKIKKFSRQKKNVFEILSNSLAPTIHGHEYIKKAILCMLLGGVERILENGTRIRGDINILLIGDPSVAKSQLLRYVLHSAPRAVTTTGRGSSGVGLTAAVTTDQESGERRLEAGAMVLADRGVVCIDEFDKMSDMDRTAIHEVMEQGRVTIAKAGIHAKLNARCSVLAAANPIYGRYNQYKTPMENIGLQDSLLSRFDLLFIVLDMNDPENDRMISDHILNIHKFRSPAEQDGDVLHLSSSLDLLTTESLDEVGDDDDVPIYETFHTMLGGVAKKEQYVSLKFMRKYLHVAREMKPQMTREAADYIAEEYSKLRNMDTAPEDVARTQPVTARSLETMIRLSTSHAKCRLSKTVEIQDAQAALELIHYAYFKKVLKKDRRRKHVSDSEGEDEVEEEEEGSLKLQKRSKRSRLGDDDVETGNENEDKNNVDNRVTDSMTSSAIAEKEDDQLSGTKLQRIRGFIFKKFQADHSQSLSVDLVWSFVEAQHAAEVITRKDFDKAIQHMHDQNQIMLHEQTIYLI